MTNCSTVAADIIFVLDSSASILQNNFVLIKDFVKSVIDKFIIGPTKTRFGLIVFRFADTTFLLIMA